MSRKLSETYLEEVSPLTKIDEVYKRIGPFGRANLFYLFCLSWMNLAAYYLYTHGVFLMVVPEWRCKEGEMGCNLTTKLCDLDRSQWEWVNPDRTMVSHFELQCTMDKAYLAISLFFIPGSVIGLLFCGPLSDRYGRKKVLIAGQILCALSTIGEAFSPVYAAYITFRITTGAAFMLTSVQYTYTSELFPSSSRPLCIFASRVVGTCGTFILAGIYYLFHSWRAIPLGSSALMLCGLTCLVLPESPHWLLVNSGADAANAVLKRIARWNGCAKEITDQIQLTEPTVSKNESGNAIRILRSKEHLVVSLQLFYHWFLVALLSYSFIYSLDAIAGDLVVNVIIMGAISVPFFLLTTLLMSRIGRRRTLFLNLSVIVICCALAMLKVDLGSDWTLERVAIVIGSKWGTSSNWMVVPLLTDEILPTSVRITGNSIGSIFSRIGSFVAPFLISHASKSSFYLMYGVFIGLTLLGLGLGWTIPETRNQDLRLTIADKGSENNVVETGKLLGKEESEDYEQ